MHLCYIQHLCKFESVALGAKFFHYIVKRDTSHVSNGDKKGVGPLLSAEIIESPAAPGIYNNVGDLIELPDLCIHANETFVCIVRRGLFIRVKYLHYEEQPAAAGRSYPEDVYFISFILSRFKHARTVYLAGPRHFNVALFAPAEPLQVIELVI